VNIDEADRAADEAAYKALVEYLDGLSYEERRPMSADEKLRHIAALMALAQRLNLPPEYTEEEIAEVRERWNRLRKAYGCSSEAPDNSPGRGPRDPRPRGRQRPMTSKGSVTRWIGQLQAGDPEAAQRLWERYFRRLVGLARKKLHDAPRRAADEEDVALSAFDSFCRSAGRGRFPLLADRDGLWRLLVALTARKAAHLLRDQGRQKRGGAQPPASGAAEPSVEELLSREPSPEFAAQVAEEYRRLLALLGDPELEAIALAKMDGCTTEEVAAKLGKAPHTVKRKLRLIRDIWAQEAEG
jgi:DNA-directed RNA polymerase specialized sigma24 family protein